MKVKVKLNNNGINKICNNSVKALILTGEVVKTDLIQSQTMPFRSGTMQNDSTYVEPKYAKQGKVYILADTPYSRKLYFHPEFDFSKDKNPNAGGRWFDIYVFGEKKEFVMSKYKQILRKLNGG